PSGRGAGGEGSAREVILGENESARVEKNETTGGPRLVLNRLAGDPPVFIRRLVRPPRVLDLLDIVAGGYGTGRRRERGIDPTTGMEDPMFFPQNRGGDGRQYRPVGWHRLIDGVFVPDGKAGRVQLDSAGHAFDGFPATAGTTWGSLWSWAAEVKPDNRMHGLVFDVAPDRRFMPEGRGALAFHPNTGVTFDLQAMRKLYPDVRPARFRAVAGLPSLPTKPTGGFSWIYSMDSDPASQDLDGNGAKDWAAKKSGSGAIAYSHGIQTVASDGDSMAHLASGSRWGLSDNEVFNAQIGTGSYTVEFSAKLAAGSSYPYQLDWVADQGNDSLREALYVGADRTTVTASNGETVLDGNTNSDAYHVFRLAYDSAACKAYVWRDGKYLGSFAPPMDGTKLGAFFGGGTGGTGGVAEVDYLALTSGAYAPDVERVANLPPSVDLWVFVDGQLRLKRSGLRRHGGTVDVDVELGPGDRFLTLAVTDGDDDINSDWFVLGDPVLQVVAAGGEKEVVP
ncbi:MAG: hypothetical protein L6306_17575, partial [Planctomycetales bacterium]|nr:hypothetical protein [Planctomycetales bacterium]